MKTKIKGENSNIEVVIKEATLEERKEFNDIFNQSMYGQLKWSGMVECVLIATTFTEDDLNELTDVDIIEICKECYLVLNKKKLKK
tara:strand:- start:699 stop:956 length:258 start_codon:yes stop_codon:yes gene_type:complete